MRKSGVKMIIHDVLNTFEKRKKKKRKRKESKLLNASLFNKISHNVDIPV
jgi:hypothetical protein